MTSLKEIITDRYQVTMLTPNIIENIYFDEKVIDVDLMDEIKEVNMKMMEGKPYAVLAIFGPNVEITPETRTHVAKKGFKKNNVLSAIITSNFSHRLIANFYLKINKPNVKTRLFDNREKALVWLQQEMADYLKNAR